MINQSPNDSAHDSDDDQLDITAANVTLKTATGALTCTQLLLALNDKANVTNNLLSQILSQLKLSDTKTSVKEALTSGIITPQSVVPSVSSHTGSYSKTVMLGDMLSGMLHLAYNIACSRGITIPITEALDDSNWGTIAVAVAKWPTPDEVPTTASEASKLIIRVLHLGKYNRLPQLSYEDLRSVLEDRRTVHLRSTIYRIIKKISVVPHMLGCPYGYVATMVTPAFTSKPSTPTLVQTQLPKDIEKESRLMWKFKIKERLKHAERQYLKATNNAGT